MSRYIYISEKEIALRELAKEKNMLFNDLKEKADFEFGTPEFYKAQSAYCDFGASLTDETQQLCLLEQERVENRNEYINISYIRSSNPGVCPSDCAPIGISNTVKILRANDINRVTFSLKEVPLIDIEKGGYSWLRSTYIQEGAKEICADLFARTKTRPEYEPCVEWVDRWRRSGYSWAELKLGRKNSIEELQTLIAEEQENNFWPEDLNFSIWEGLVIDMAEEERA